jgi:hypothetical protein
MTLEEGLRQHGSPYRIKGCSRLDLPEYLAKNGFHRGVEIGVYKAEFTEHFAKAGLEIYGVDPWMAQGYEGHEHRQKRQDFLYGHASRVLTKYPNCRLIRKTSMDAVKDFKDNSLDFVYIDGNHGLKYAIEDMWEWSKKVRSGGIVSGHDWGHKPMRGLDSFCLHVTPAVDAYVTCMHIKDWYVIGGVVQRGDKWKSFLWIKE